MQNIPFKLSLRTAMFYFLNFFIFGAANYFGLQCIQGTDLCPVSITGSLYTPGEAMMIFFQFFLGGFNMLQTASTYQTVKEGIRCSK
jgi:hypothetical protein